MESTSSLTFKAMQDAAKENPEIAARVELFEHRVPEEFYDPKNDPDALNNLIDDPALKPEIETVVIAKSSLLRDYSGLSHSSGWTAS